ncbi:uncharacterized protein LOC125179225, partial [Hyalella azteca]|uniref:Uncharacterized protein LOC125179225 n=1 Tax=Hyalella azteca TaxID=294128 RepID=A0A979FTU4_HYAAZ
HERYRGYLMIREGDNFVRDLHDHSTPAYHAKAAKYQAMLDAVYMRSLLAPAFEAAEVTGFGPSVDPTTGELRPGLGVDFRITLDRRRVPGHISAVERAVQATLVQELISVAPVAFTHTVADVDTFTLTSG